MKSMKFIFLCAVIFIISCSRTYGEQKENEYRNLFLIEYDTEIISKDDYYIISKKIYDKFYTKGMIMYSRFGDWKKLFLVFFDRMHVPEISGAINNIEYNNIKINLSLLEENAFPNVVKDILNRKYIRQDAICSEKIPYTGDDVFEYTGMLSRVAMERGYPITAVSYAAAGNKIGEYVVTFDFFADCDKSELLVQALVNAIR
ncbi:MAG: hypothetical protein ACOY99_10905 [Pseudomonadota bacterium]